MEKPPHRPFVVSTIYSEAGMPHDGYHNVVPGHRNFGINPLGYLLQGIQLARKFRINFYTSSDFTIFFLRGLVVDKPDQVVLSKGFYHRHFLFSTFVFSC